MSHIFKPCKYLFVSNFVLIEQHVGNAVCDGKHAPCLWALKLSLDHVNFTKQVMQSLLECRVFVDVIRLCGRDTVTESCLRDIWRLLYDFLLAPSVLIRLTTCAAP